MRSPLLKLIGRQLAVGQIAAASGDDDDAPVSTGEPQADEAATEDDAMVDEMADVVATAVAAGEFPTLVAAIEAAGLVETLQGEGPFTVFAPTEDAFAAALDALGLTPEQLLGDTELLTSVLTYHVVPGKNLAADVVGLDGSDVATVNGATVAVALDGDSVMVNDASVVTTDIEASNGVIHVIDTVLLPPA